MLFKQQMKLFGTKYVKDFVHQKNVCTFIISFCNHISMKKACFLVVFCIFAAMLLSSCRSSKPCPAYRTVISYEEQPASTDLPG